MLATKLLESLNEAEPGMVLTRNRTGFMFTELSEINRDFADYASKCTEPVVDIGCAYGLSTLAVLAQSRCDVWAIDLSADHLNTLRRHARPEDAARLYTVARKFPDRLNLPDESVEGIQISNVLHFLRGSAIERGLEKCFHALVPGGRLYIETCAVYFTYYRDYLPVYEARAARGDDFPGEISNLYKYYTAPDPTYKPVRNPFFHVFKAKDIEAVVRNAGFKVVRAEYFDRTNLSDTYDAAGRSWVGLVAEKPFREASR